MEPLYRHSAGILTLLPSDEVPRSRTPTPQEALFAALPLSFNRQQALEEAERNNIPTATLDTCLKRMQERGTLEKNGRGEYSFGGRVTHKVSPASLTPLYNVPHGRVCVRGGRMFESLKVSFSQIYKS